jgi:hypothetical protein
MEIDDADKKRNRIRTINEQVQVTEDALIIESRDMDSTPIGKIKFSEIEAINIKEAGTLYDGEVSFVIAGSADIKFKFKKYQQEDFEELKEKLGK